MFSGVLQYRYLVVLEHGKLALSPLHSLRTKCTVDSWGKTDFNVSSDQGGNFVILGARPFGLQRHNFF